MRVAALLLVVATVALCVAAAAPVHASPKCAICEFLASEVENFVENQHTEQEIVSLLGDVCTLLPGSYRFMCTMFVKGYGPTLIKKILDRETPEVVCQQLGVCPKSEEPVAPTPTPTPKVGGGNLECSLCTLIVSEVEKIVGENKTEANIEAALDKVCDVLPSALSGPCETLVNRYTPAMIALIAQNYPADVVCQKIGLCTSSAPAPAPTPAPKVGGGNLECSLCTLIVSEVEKIVGENKTEANIEAALDKVCDVLPSALSGPCETLVNRYTPAMIALIAQNYPADVVCQKIGLCTTSGDAPHPLGDFKCAACEYIATLAEKFMANNHTESEVVSFVEKVCSFLPSALSAECDVIVESYGPVIIDYIINKEDPETLCTQLDLCKRSSEEKQQPGPLKGLECAACEYLMSLVESVLGNNATEQEIVQFVDKVCTLFPSALRAPCEAIIETYGPQLIDFLLAREDPATFCGQVGLCKSSSSEKVGSSFLCPVCTVAISYLENYITANSTEAEITSLVENLCNVLPSVLALPCDAFVEEYGPHLINWLVNKEPPGQFCSTIGLCSKSKMAATSEYVHVPHSRS